jgi:hypothetical protein
MTKRQIKRQLSFEERKKRAVDSHKCIRDKIDHVKKCPMCSAWISKVSGCDSMRCKEKNSVETDSFFYCFFIRHNV